MNEYLAIGSMIILIGLWFKFSPVPSVQNGDQIKNQGYVEQTGHAIDDDTFNG